MKDTLRIFGCLLFMLFVYFAVVCVLGQVVCNDACGATPDWCVRVEVQEGKYRAFGSGTLVSPTHVITNWHVVKDRKSQDIKLHFPALKDVVIGKVLNQNEKWDAAIIVLPAVDVTPIEIGNVPANGARVTIHGYGPGTYRARTGVLSSDLPSPDKKMEPGLRFIDRVIARQGDSGGPVTYQGTYIGTIIGAKNDTLFVDVDRVNTLFGIRK